MRRRSLAALAFAVGLSACLPELPRASEGDPRGDEGPGPAPFEPGPESDAGYELPPADPHAILGVDPAHGPFQGGQRRIVRGHGFSSKVRVFFGPNEVPESDRVAIDPGRVQVVVPPGVAGPVDVRTQNGDDASTSRTLIGGYVYDAFYAEPDNGPTSGGTRITFRGQGTSFGSGTTVRIAGKDCEDVEVLSKTELRCTSPAHTPGEKSVTIAGEGESLSAQRAFTYADSEDGFRGGFSGSKLESRLQVIALNSFTGAPIPGAIVVADGPDGHLHRLTDAKGIALFEDEALGPSRTVTVAAKCHEPLTFADVPVEKVTAYLDPILSPACISDDPATVGGRPGQPGRVRGQLLWPFVGEFHRGSFSNVPEPVGEEVPTAYVFTTTSSPTQDFRLPDPRLAITPESRVGEGFAFDVATPVGHLVLYALAGLEDRSVSPPKFKAFAMGVQRGIGAQPGGVVTDVFLEMNVVLEQALTMRVVSPKPGPRGPDRVRATVAVELGPASYAILPGLQKTALAPMNGELTFVGLPSLEQALASSRYVIGARAGTGSALDLPLSVHPSLATNDPSRILALDDFVEAPIVTMPAPNESWDGRSVTIAFPEGSTAVDLIVYEIVLGGGLVTWTVATPGDARSVDLPDLAALSSDLGLPKGPVTIRVSAARIRDFDYANLQSRHLGRGAWNGYAIEQATAHY